MKKEYPIIKKCKGCLNDFKINDPYHNGQKYCSYKCANNEENRRRRERYIKHPLEAVMYKHKCKNCGKRFKNKLRDSKYCDRECFEQHMKTLRIGKNNPAYRNGFYSHTTKKERNEKRKITAGFGEKEYSRVSRRLKQAQKDKFGFSFCEHCSCNSSLRWETHHIVYRSEKPKHENLHEPKNLLILCINCHNLFHKNKKIRNKYIIERGLGELFGEGLIR